MTTSDQSVGSTEAVPPSLGDRVASSARWAFLDQAFQQVVRIGLTVALTRLASPRDFGLIGLAFLVTALSSFITDLGLGPALVQRREVTEAHIRTAVSTTALVGVLLAIVTIAAAHPVAAFFDEPRLAAVLVVLSANFPLRGLLGVPRDLLRRDLRFRDYAVQSAIGVAVGGTLGVTLGALGAGVWALVAYSVGESVAGCIACAVLAVRAGVLPLRPGFDRQAFRDLFSFGAAVSGVKLLYYAEINLDNLLVGKFLGARALGLYGLAYRIMLYPIQKVADVIGEIALPTFSLIQTQPARMGAAYVRAIRTICLVCFPVSIGVAATAPLLVPVVFGAKWVPAVTVVEILAVNGPRLALNRLCGSVYQAVGHPSWDLAMSLAGVAAYGIAFAIGIHYGILGMAIAYTIAGHLMLPPAQMLVSRALAITVWRPARAVLPIATATAVMWLLVLVTRGLSSPIPSMNARLVMSVVVGASSYVFVVFVLDRNMLTDARQALFHGAGAAAQER